MVVKQAQRAEDLGLDAALMSCHYFNRDPFLTLTAVAEATEQIDVGPVAVNSYEYHPTTLASKMSTLDEFSDGRALFGIGAGDQSTLKEQGIERERPLRRVLETIRATRSLWRGMSVDHAGTFATENARLRYDANCTPIYVAAQGTHMTRMGMKHADGVFFQAAHPADLRWLQDQLHDSTESIQPEESDIIAYVPLSVDDDRGKAIDYARGVVATVVAGANDDILERHAIDLSASERLREDVVSESFDLAMNRVTLRMVDRFAVAGTPEMVADRLDRLFSFDFVDGIVLAPPLGPDTEFAINHTSKWAHR